MRRSIEITRTCFVLLLAGLLAACEPAPRDLNFGSDECAHCRMLITEKEFASQLINRQGRVFPFDSIECMAAFEQEMASSEDIHSRWVPDFAAAGIGWLRVEQATILQSETLRSPMGIHLSAYASRAEAEQFAREYGGSIRSWDEILQLVAEEWQLGGPQ